MAKKNQSIPSLDDDLLNVLEAGPAVPAVAPSGLRKWAGRIGKGGIWALLALAGYDILKRGHERSDMGRTLAGSAEGEAERLFRGVNMAQEAIDADETRATTGLMRRASGDVEGLGRLAEGLTRRIDRNHGPAELARILDDNQEILQAASFRSPPNLAEIYMRHGVL